MSNVEPASAMGHVLILSLGPVQDFIASARRCRDLWFGSWLLSELSKATALAIAETCGGEEALIFPGLSLVALEPTSTAMVANKVVVRVPPGLDPEILAEEVGRAAMKARLREIRDLAFSRIHEEKLPGARYFDRRKAEEQVDDLIELIWVSVSEATHDGYAKARAEAEALLTARKATSLWGPVTWGARVPKSSLDGARESVLFESLFEDVKEKRLTGQACYEAYGVGPSERLCGVGLLKRHGQSPGSRYVHRFLSTGHLAAWPLLERLSALSADAKVKATWDEFLKTLEGLGALLEEAEVPRDREHPVLGPYDGSLLFDNRLVDLFELVTEPEEKRRKVTKARQALAGVLKLAKVPTPLPYYAILAADGDRMGEAIDRLESPAEHRRLSQALAAFATEAREIVEADHQGELVYAGGDDVLAFVPLHHAVACARSLADRFRKHLEGFPAGEGKTPTLSAGIGISHFLEPMGHALQVAREAEHRAKTVAGKNAFCLIVDKRSGVRSEMADTWGTLDLELQEYTALHAEDKVPDGAAYELRTLGRLLENLEGEKVAQREALEKLVRKETERILRRKQPEQGAAKAIDPTILRDLLARLKAKSEGLPELADRLIAARLLAEARLQAKPPEKENS